MMVEIRFPDREMQRAFVCEGLKGMGYTYVEPDCCSVEFCFADPMSKQPLIREKLRNSVQGINQKLVNTYNSLREKYGITCNDPNVISQAFNQPTEIAEKNLYEKLIHHFNRKAGLKEEINSCNL